jgi:hypothetical protein
MHNKWIEIRTALVITTSEKSEIFWIKKLIYLGLLYRYLINANILLRFSHLF